MKKIILLTFISVSIFSCKSKKSSTENNNNETVSETFILPEKGSKKMDAEFLNIIEKHYNINKEFNTLQINAEVDYKNQEINQNVSADIRIEKGKTILIAIKKFGITGAKILVTPNRVSYYEIIQGTHYDGDFAFISNFLGTNLNYNQIENLLLGTSIFELTDTYLTTKYEDGLYKMYKEEDVLNLIFVFDAIAQVKQEVIAEKGTAEKLVIDYLSYQKESQMSLPKNLSIRAIQKNETNLKIDYKKVSVNPNISFTYKIPNGSKQLNFN